MSIAELFIIAVGLSMDAFAVSVCKGLSMPVMNWKGALIVGLYFGGFQAAMPLLGFFLGTGFSQAIEQYDHWVAFLLLAVIGGNMIKEGMEGEEECPSAALDVKTMTLLAIATSIDALAVGVTFAFLRVDIVPAVIFIGTVTFFLSMTGVKVGNAFGSKYKSKAEIAGGLILVLMGVKILLEHLGILF
ncbi:manganese efflux pump MntP [Lacrimispora sp. 210928-DFI.3.58]|uniref:manganese efflux pump MntP n=1 Tax=Lacrimispora sp. 210928-DFI.3.58 TaxID=2883214 RepID=UPI0015B3D09A|nr:manganese efflux pump MntP family protein [Lacrimispora sp. 210928-DFI.3.58]MCB7317188.1 manganese efflux pump MntP family protein [Lacrimispora sp. 210928-DFI.3.58]